MLDVVVNEHYVDDNVSWSAYHALQCTKALAAVMNTVNTLLPLFHESANTVAMAFTQCHTSSSSAHKARPDYSCNSWSAIARFRQRDTMVADRYIGWDQVPYTYGRFNTHRNGFSPCIGWTGWMVLGRESKVVSPRPLLLEGLMLWMREHVTRGNSSR